MNNFELVKKILGELKEEYQKPVIRFRLEPGETGPLESKVGGTPYLPHNEAWPVDKEGAPMIFLAQVNCRELKDMPDFPHTGLLQFFVGADDVIGVDFDNITNNDGFRVFYREQLDETVTTKETAAKHQPAEDEYSPLGDAPCRICFDKATTESIVECDYQFDALFLEKWNQLRPDAPQDSWWSIYSLLTEDEHEELGLYEFESEQPFHKLGGFPYFTQDDPRRNEKYHDLDTLLFQLDTDMRDKTDLVLWGDCGVGNFFINRNALINKDFSRVGYSWDCC